MKYGTSVEMTEFIDVAMRAEELGCRVPSGVALLPGNFAAAADSGEFRFHAAVPEVRSAWRHVGIVDNGPYRETRRTDGPARGSPDQSVRLVVFLGLDSDYRVALSALGLVATILAASPSSAVAREAELDLVVQRPSRSGYACLKYRGFASDITALVEPVQRIREGN